jgi:hypothetical protein
VMSLREQCPLVEFDGCVDCNRRSECDCNEAKFHQTIYRYAYESRRKGIPWLLTHAEAAALLASACMYCGQEPSRPVQGVGGVSLAGGIDRLDSSGPYIVDNCVPCCKDCNYAKKEKTEEEWMSYLDRLILHRMSRYL